jgi:sarcosine oxidase
MTQHYDALVIGSGIHGLCSAWALKRAGVNRIAILERRDFGHDRGSSHGTSRITRSTYSDAAYVRLMQSAHDHAWPALAADLDEALITPRAMCLFGPSGGPVEDYQRAVVEAGAPVKRLALEDARARFPDFRFEANAVVLDDPTAGVIAAQQTMEGLARWLQSQGVALFTRVEVEDVRDIGSAVRVRADRDDFEADCCVITAGAWTGQLVPVTTPRLTPIRQTVAYFDVTGPAGQQRAENLPVWVYVGETQNEVFYGLPQFGRPGIKIARHVTAGGASDPDGDRTVQPEKVDDVRQMAERLLALPLGACVGSETCLYTNTATEDVIWDSHPESVRIAIGSGFSGHGFKFGPLSGQILAELALTGTCALPEFEAHRQRFALLNA